MAEYSIGPLKIRGYKDKPVPNRFFRNIGTADHLAVIFPGLRYTCDMPLLFYATKVFLSQGFDVLQLHPDYTQKKFSAASPDRQIDQLGADAWGAVQTAETQREYSNLVLLGKSIGTLAMSVLLLDKPALRQHITIWLTPLYRLPLVEQATQQLMAPALLVSGTGDSTFDQERLDYLSSVIQCEARVYEEADHSLEIPQNLAGTLEVLQDTMMGLNDFLRRKLPS